MKIHTIELFKTFIWPNKKNFLKRFISLYINTEYFHEQAEACRKKQDVEEEEDKMV